jgi:RNA polymerase sigma factor (sigma-70 family)
MPDAPAAFTSGPSGVWPGVLDAAVAEYEPSLVRYAARLLADPAAARDVVQETFLALGTRARAEVAGRVGPWLFAVCRRKALNVLRAARPQARGPAAEAAVARVAEEGAGPAEGLAQAEDGERLRALVAALPAAQQEVVRLRFQEDFSYAEIAEVTALSVSHVGVLLHQAMRSLRAAWVAAERKESGL